MTRTHRDVWQYVCGSMWPDTVEMWPCTVNSSQYKGRPNVTLVSVIITHNLTLIAAVLFTKKVWIYNYQQTYKVIYISNATSYINFNGVHGNQYWQCPLTMATYCGHLLKLKKTKRAIGSCLNVVTLSAISPSSNHLFLYRRVSIC